MEIGLRPCLNLQVFSIAVLVVVFLHRDCVAPFRS